MRNSDSELAARHLRWVANRLLISLKCYFCGEPLIPQLLKAKAWWNIQKLVTIHHKNGVHEDDSPENIAHCHVTCHRRYHIQEREKK